MEFKSLRNIESSFKVIRLFALLFMCFSLLSVIVTIVVSYHFAERQRQRIYVLDQGKSLMLALQQDEQQNRPIEAREHVRRFHELFFQFAPNKSSIEENINRSLSLCDKSAFRYYQDLSESGYYSRVLSNNITQQISIDSLVGNFQVYPYRMTTYARQFIIRRSNISVRRLVTQCDLINTSRSDSNPQGFMMEKFVVLDNSEIKTSKR